MKRQWQIFAIVLFVGILGGMVIALVVRQTSSEGTPGSALKAKSGAWKPTSSASNKVRMKREEDIARVEELENMVLEKKQREQAEEKTHMARVQLQFYNRPAWTKLIEGNRQKFEALRKEAAQSPDKMVPCTICDAQGVLDLCVVCDHSGKCPTCRGEGKDFGKICPTCVGSGKCFLCLGAGNMPCPFCQALPVTKEVITPDTPDPPTEIPIN